MKDDFFPKVELMEEKLPKLELDQKLFVIAEGFEPRSTYWLQNQNEEFLFTDSIICMNLPQRESKFDELNQLIKLRTVNDPLIVNFERYSPYSFEGTFIDLLNKKIDLYSEVIIDISVMSKLLIMIIINSFKDFKGRLRVIYTEPEYYAPSLSEYNHFKNALENSISLPSFGVNNVVRTPGLSSVIMQRSPSLVVAFLSFNEQLIRALLSSLNPTNLLLVNGVPPSLFWREKAMIEIHETVIKEYSSDNLTEDGKLIRSSSTLNYIETFFVLTDIYKKHCFTRRIIISPTGSKMQALACAIFRLCCSDVHIEYPNPESYLIKNYSSSKIKNVYQVQFNSFKKNIENIDSKMQLSG